MQQSAKNSFKLLYKAPSGAERLFVFTFIEVLFIELLDGDLRRFLSRLMVLEET